MNLVAKIAAVAGDIPKIPGVFANVQQSYPSSVKPALQLAKDLLSYFFEVH